MTLPTVFLIAIALGTDAFSMAISIGLAGITRHKAILVSVIVALFHVIMPLIGLYLGTLLGRAVGQFAAFIGAAVLIFIGIQMLWEGFKSQPAASNEAANTNSPFVKIPMQVYSGLGAMLVLAASVSLDALTVGFGLGTLQVNLTLTVLIMGFAAGIMTIAGMFLGKKIGAWLGEKALIAGGIILIIIGIKMLF